MFKSHNRLVLVMALVLLASGCVQKVQNVGRETHYLNEKAVAKQIELENSFQGNKLLVSIQALGDRPYEVEETIQKQYACGATHKLFQLFNDSPGSYVWLPVALPFGLLADTVSLCQKKSYSRDTSIEKGVSKDSRFPSDLIDDISGNLHISEITTGQVFSDGPVVYENTNGKFEIDLPLLNNGGTLRVQFDGNVVIGSQELPLRIDRQVTL